MITINHTTGPRNKAQRVCGTHIGIFVLRDVPVLSQREITCIYLFFGGGGGFTEQKERDKHFWGNLLLMNVYKTFF